MDGHRNSPRRERRCHHPSSQRAWLGYLDTDLDVWHVVEVEHDVGATRVDPTSPQARPHFVQKFLPYDRKLLPRRGCPDDSRRTGDHVHEAYLVTHVRSSNTPTVRHPR